MTYSDDILNVNAYLRSKMRKNADDSMALAQDMEDLGKSYQEMLRDSKALLTKAQALAAELGVDISDLEMPQIESANQLDCSDSTDLLVHLPKDYDFAQAFERLRKEAHAAGFTNTRPEELLSPEEIASAEAFHEEIEARFEKATSLRSKDVLVMSIAVALRIICKLLFPLSKLKGAATDNHFQPSSQPAQDQAASALLPADDEQTPTAVDAFAGVNMDDLIRSTKSVSKTITTGDQVISKATGRQPMFVGIKSYSQILSDPIPFDMPDNEYFSHQEALGYNKFLGWLFGVLNIMTNTVTTTKLNTFSVIQYNGGAAQPAGLQKISTFVHLLLPVMTNTPNKDALLASVVREAGVQNITKAPPEHVSDMLKKIFDEEERTLSRIQTTGEAATTASGFIGQTIEEIEQSLPVGSHPKAASTMSKTKGVLGAIPGVIFDITRDTAIIAFLNKLITAIHSVMYDPETDGPVEMYAIRTNSILTTSNVIATAFNSLEAVISKNPAKIDFAGVITSCISIFNSTRFWIDVKSNYLFNAYMPGIEEQTSLVDKYFVFTDE